MKIAVSIPDELFEQLEEHRERCGATRSEFIRTALTRYLAHRQMEEITASYDAHYDEEMAEEDRRFAAAAQHSMGRILEREGW